jgi:hypothetical protein
VVKSAIACAAVKPPAFIVPVTIPGGKPVTAVPGLTPRSPVIREAQLLVTVDPARTAKLAADTRDTGAWVAAVRLRANIVHKYAVLIFLILDRTALNVFIGIVFTFG